MTTTFLLLHSKKSSLVLETLPNEAPLWRYWGPRLPDAASPNAALRETRPLPSFMLDFDQPLTIAPTFGVGWFGQSALLAHREGKAFAQAFTQCEIEWISPQKKVRIHLTDTIAKIKSTISLSLDEASDVLSAQTTLTNLGATPLEVQHLSAITLLLPSNSHTVRSYAGQHMHEFLLQEDVLTRSRWQRENRRGRTSQDCFPGAVVTTPGATAHAGLVYGAHLAWSGNSQQTIEWLPDAQYQWQIGEWLAPGEVRLATNESIVSPEVVATCSSDGFNGLAANFHAELRSRLQWPSGKMQPRKVHLNTWEGFYFDLEPEKIKALATSAAVIGVERFVLDDGWFNARHHDRAGLGDWWPDASKFPAGLGDLIAHVSALGMEFGLWFEPEMVNPDSDTFRAHPDWALQLNGRPLITARNQLVLDISRADVSNYLFEKMDALLSKHPIGYIKWDHNRDLTVAGLANGNAGYRAQVHAAYALMARLREKHPTLEIESCSGGGGRIDFAVLRHALRVWTSDCIDALSRVDIQRNFLQFFPPEIMGAHIGTSPAHTTGRTQSMGFRASVALPGHLGVELDSRVFDAATKAEVTHWIALYKALRDRLHCARVWLGDAGDGVVWQAHGDTENLLAFFYRLLPSSAKYVPAAQLPMLDENRTYRVRRIVPEGTHDHHWFAPPAPFFNEVNGDGVLMDGAWLKNAGLPLPRAHAQTCWIVELKAI